MKKRIISEILAGVSPDLEESQMASLRSVLESTFEQIQMLPSEPASERRERANKELLQAFISAKKIEGCSEKTLHYYQSTIEALLSAEPKGVEDLTTNDIRSYLAAYQERRHSSRVTIDNIRRIFSSFFAWLEDEDYIAKSPVRRDRKSVV